MKNPRLLIPAISRINRFGAEKLSNKDIEKLNANLSGAIAYLNKKKIKDKPGIMALRYKMLRTKTILLGELSTRKKAREKVVGLQRGVGA